MTKSYPRIIAPGLAIAVLLIGGCGQESPPPGATPAAMPAVEQPEAPPARPLTVFDTGGPLAITPVMEAWRAEGGGRFAIAESDYSNPFPDETDVLVAGSLAALWAFAEEDKLRPVFSPTIEGRIDELYRDPESRWVGLSYRVKIVFYNPDLVDSEELQTVQSYASLGDERWAGRLCLSSSRVDGNQLLVAWLIRRHGEREAEMIVRRWRANLREGFVEASDYDVSRKIIDGECALGLISTSQTAPLHSADVIRPHWFDDPDGMMVDITGAGVSRHAGNPEQARAFLEWLTTEGANAFLASSRREWPASADAATSNALAAWSEYFQTSVPLADLGFLLRDAELLVERAGYP